MTGTENTLLVLLLIFFLGLVVPELFKKLRLPYITSLVLIGALLGPNGFNVIELTESIEFFGFLGLTFLMFMSGLEVQTDYLKHSFKRIFILAIINSAIPFIVGLFITRAFGYGWIEALLMGTIFISSSVAIVIPSIKEARLFKRQVGQSIVAAVVLQDVLSLFILALIFQQVQPITPLPLWLYFVLLVGSVVILRYLLPRLATLFVKRITIFTKDEEHEDQLRFVIVMLIGVLALFSLLGVHPILAAFLVGMLLSDVLTSKKIYRKFHTLGYGLFIPIFFFIIGMEMNLVGLFNLEVDNTIVFTIIIGLMSSKFISGYLAGRLVNLNEKHSALFATASMSQLTTTLAAVYAASSAGLIGSTFVTGALLLATITTIVVPVILKNFFSLHK